MGIFAELTPASQTGLSPESEAIFAREKETAQRVREEELSRRLGSDWQLTTPGIQSMQAFEEQWDLEKNRLIWMEKQYGLGLAQLQLQRDLGEMGVKAAGYAGLGQLFGAGIGALGQYYGAKALGGMLGGGGGLGITGGGTAAGLGTMGALSGWGAPTGIGAAGATAGGGTAAGMGLGGLASMGIPLLAGGIMAYGIGKSLFGGKTAPSFSELPLEQQATGQGLYSLEMLQNPEIVEEYARQQGLSTEEAAQDLIKRAGTYQTMGGTMQRELPSSIYTQYGLTAPIQPARYGFGGAWR